MLQLSRRRPVERPRVKVVEQHHPTNTSLLAAEGGVGQPNLGTVAQLHYLKVAEVQRRGLAHFHCVLRLDGPKSIEC